MKDLVEKPSADKAPSNLGVTGRYVLPPAIFGYLAKTKPGKGGDEAGFFMFHPREHDEGQKTVLGHVFPAGQGEADGDQLLDLLAAQPATAHFLAFELARHFVSDEPPAALVENGPSAGGRILPTRLTPSALEIRT